MGRCDPKESADFERGLFPSTIMQKSKQKSGAKKKKSELAREMSRLIGKEKKEARKK